MNTPRLEPAGRQWQEARRLDVYRVTHGGLTATGAGEGDRAAMRAALLALRDVARRAEEDARATVAACEAMLTEGVNGG